MFWSVYFLLVSSKTGDIFHDSQPTPDDVITDNHHQPLLPPPSTPKNGTATTIHVNDDKLKVEDPSLEQNMELDESYRLFLSQMEDQNDIDDGFEVEDDSYFSPSKK